MAYEKPTAAEFKAAMPAFAAVTDAAVGFALNEGDSMTSPAWGDARAGGVILWAAHALTLDGQGATNEARLAGFARMKSGSFELDRMQRRGGDTTLPGSMESTSYGVRFAELRARVLGPAILVV